MLRSLLPAKYHPIPSTSTDASYDLDRPKLYLAMHNIVGPGLERKTYAQRLSGANFQSIAKCEPEATS